AFTPNDDASRILIQQFGRPRLQRLATWCAFAASCFRVSDQRGYLKADLRAKKRRLILTGELGSIVTAVEFVGPLLSALSDWPSVSIYVETRIHGQMADLWEKTQDPQLHQCWDARFSLIKPLARTNELQPQTFQYSTRIGFGISIAGEGETVCLRDQSGKCT